MTSPYSAEAMRARFHALGQQEDEIRATSPRAERDARAAELTMEQFRAFREPILEHEKDLYDIAVERAALARALNGKTGPKPG